VAIRVSDTLMAIAVLFLRPHVGFQHRINACLVALLTLGLEMVEHRFFDPQGYVLGSVRLNQLGVGPEFCIGFEVIPRRWVVERTIAWINRCRRLAKDYENLNRTAIAFIRLASIRLMLRRITRYCYPS